MTFGIWLTAEREIFVRAVNNYYHIIVQEYERKKAPNESIKQAPI